MGHDFQVDVRQSGIWQLSSAVISSAGACLVVDPGYFPRELDELAGLARERGEVAAVAFTHGHWDHVIGWRCFPGAPVWVSPGLQQAIAGGSELANKNLAEARDFDGRWYVERPAPLCWPPSPRALAEGEELALGEILVQALHLPGHSPDGLGLLCARHGLLLVGDYLSPCEIPFVEDLHAYRDTLKRLLRLLSGVTQVIPGHGGPLTGAEAGAIAAADLAYLDALALLGERGDLAGARALPLPRAGQVPGMREHHLDNCRQAGL